jgi:CheY-like chemotaxis protein
METREKRRILVIDDEPSFTRLLKVNLERQGSYEVRAENNGAKVLQVALEFRPNLIFLDVMMPEKDGGEIAAEFEKHESLKKIPIVFLTAAVSKEEAGTDGKLIAGRAFLAKPVTLADVTKCIEKHAA